jgi:hypothetical protein
VSVDLDSISLRAPSYPEGTPFWPCVYFMHGEEIVAALWFDDGGDDVPAYGVSPEGVVDDTPIESTEHVVGWTLHILAEGRPSGFDPRVMSPEVESWGDELTLPDVMERAYEAVEARAQPLGLTYESSRERLVWAPLHP